MKRIYNIKTVGVELEGGYDCKVKRTNISDYNRFGFVEIIPFKRTEDDDADWGEDSSIEFSDRQWQNMGLTNKANSKSPWMQLGVEDYIMCHEVRSPVLKPNQISKWVRKVYPDYGNSSCGIHIHLMPKDNKIFSFYTEKSFQKYFTDRLTKWGENNVKNKRSQFWSRLNGRNQYCRKTFKPIEALLDADDPYNFRYSQINFATEELGTIEIRVLPYFSNVEKAVSAIEEVILIFEDYAKKQAKKEKKIRSLMANLKDLNKIKITNGKEYKKCALY